MSPEREPLPESSHGSDFTDSEKNDIKASADAEKDVLSGPGELDVLINNRKSTMYIESAGNRRMLGIIVDYWAQYNSGTRTQKTRIVKKALADVTKGGARFLLQISGSGEQPIRWQEISRDDAAKCIEHELKTKGSSLVDGKRKLHKKKKSSLSSHEQELEGDQSDETYEEGSAYDGDCTEDPNVCRKKPRYQSTHMSPNQQSDDISSLHRTSPRHSELERGALPMESRYTETSHSAARLPLYVQSIPPTSGLSTTAQQTTVRHLTTVAHLLNGVVHHLSRAVSTAELLSYLHSVEAASTQCTQEIYDAIAAGVELLRPTPIAATQQHATIPPLNHPFPGQPSLSRIGRMDSNVADSNVTAPQRRQGFHGALSNQQFLDTLASLVPSVNSTAGDNENANRNENQEVIRIINMLLQSLPQAPPSAS